MNEIQEYSQADISKLKPSAVIEKHTMKVNQKVAVKKRNIVIKPKAQKGIRITKEQQSCP